MYKKKKEKPTMEGWLVKMTDLAKMAKGTCIIRERIITTFIGDWKLFMDFLPKRGKMNI